MTRFISVAGAAVAVMSLGACAQLGIGGWTTLVDGTKGLENFNRVGDANWVATDGAIQASTGGKDPGYLVTKVPYKDFQMRVEFWASDDANSGIFMRCQNPSVINDESCYEANIFDTRPDPIYATGAIVKVAKLTGPDDQGRGQVEHLRHHRQGHPVDGGAQRHPDGRRRRFQVRQRAVRTAMGARRHQVPQGRDQAAVSGA